VARPSETRCETRRTNNKFTPEQDAMILRLKSQGYGPADIAPAVDKTAKQVSGRLLYLKTPPTEKAPSVGWPVPDRKRLNDWGKGFYDEDVSPERLRREFSGTPRRLQTPINHTVGGVARYG
jgi:hypothetical protein